MTQRNQDYGIGPNDTVMSPARRMFLITPSDTVAIDPIPKAVRFDGAGAVTACAVAQLRYTSVIKLVINESQ